ncbi:MAG TPA: MFS transporter [Mobilitalea sp.]|nr:MFS transporter [Mobilitalea sp.]
MKHRLQSNKGMHLLFVNAFVYISLALYIPYTSSYYSKAGINAVQIGILLTIGPLVSIFIQPLWAVISDRTGKKKRILSFVILGSALTVLTYYIGKTFQAFLLAAFLLSIFSTSIIPLSDAIILRNAKKNHYDFSKIRLGGTIGYAIMVNVSGAIVKMNPQWQFALGCIGYVLLLLFVQLLPKDEMEDIVPVQQVHLPKQSLKERLNILKIFESKQIFILLAFAFISQVGLSFHYSFLGVYMIKLGLSEGTIGFINSVSAISEIPILFLINRILKKSSTMKITAISCFLLGLRIMTVTGGNIVFLILAQLLHGLTYMTVYYSCAVFISNHVKPENQSKGQSILMIVQGGIGSIVGNILGGYLVDALGLKHAYQSMSLVIVTASAVILVCQLIYQKASAKKELHN